MNTIVFRLQEMTKKWGGELIEFDSIEIFHKILRAESDFDPSPFARYLGIFWTQRKILYHRHIHWTDIIHEMGHVFACSVPPADTNELDFFGWEYCVACNLGAEEQKAWIDAQISNDYVVENSREFRSLDANERQECLIKATCRAIELGSIKNGLPVSIR